VRGDALHLPSGIDTPLQLIYQADAADPIHRCIERQPHFHAYNIGDGAVYRLRDVVDLLKMRFPNWDADIGPGPLPRELTGLPTEEGAEATIDISRAHRDLEFTPRYGLSDALQDYADRLLAGRPKHDS
jgi:nucleoside-diphosphate-sugar epimerase